MTRFADEVVLITGASGGLGKAAAQRFGREGAKLALCDIAAERLEHTVAELRAAGYPVFSALCDVTDEAQVRDFVAATVKHFGRIDVAINNAGIDPAHHRLADMPTDDFDRVMRVNVRSVFLCMKYEIQAMLEQGGGRILNIASIAGLLGAPEMSAYAASKHAVVGLTKTAAYEYARKNIRINSLCPFITNTDMLEQTLATCPDREQTLQMLARPSALRRVAEPTEMVEGMLFACDRNNTYMVGQQLTLDGGVSTI